MMNMMLFEQVADRKLTPEEAADQLMRERRSHPQRPKWMPRVLFAFVVVVLAALLPSVVHRG